MPARRAPGMTSRSNFAMPAKADLVVMPVTCGRWSVSLLPAPAWTPSPTPVNTIRVPAALRNAAWSAGVVIVMSRSGWSALHGGHDAGECDHVALGVEYAQREVAALDQAAAGEAVL